MASLNTIFGCISCSLVLFFIENCVFGANCSRGKALYRSVRGSSAGSLSAVVHSVVVNLCSSLSVKAFIFDLMRLETCVYHVSDLLVSHHLNSSQSLRIVHFRIPLASFRSGQNPLSYLLDTEVLKQLD